MYQGIHNFSEIGKLKKVLLHRPGAELEALTPDTLGKLLFDDIPFLTVAQKEHDQFAQLLKDNGVEVVYYVQEAAKAVADPRVKEEFINEFLRLSRINSKGLRAALVIYLMGMEPEKMIEKVISGIKRSEIKTKNATSLMDLIEGEDPYVSDPMPNLYMTRDPGCCVGEGVSIHHMHTDARRREALIMRYIFKYNEDFAKESDQMWYDIRDSYSIEGGDIAVLSKDVVAVGLSPRTTTLGAENFARNLLKNSSFKKVLAFDIPKADMFSHLDTVFTMVDYDKFTIHPEVEGPMAVYEMSLDEKGELKFAAMKDEIGKVLAKELGLPAVNLIRCGGGNILVSQREQWNDASNTLCLSPGTVVTCDRNYVTNELLEKNGLKVLTVNLSELSRGRGGPRAMTCPVVREDL
ncbi:MAG: arginine deiminase [Firmicutes bacterium]|nr:arginine deiminase [Bacillota bacterium]